MNEERELNLYDVPLMALRQSTRHNIVNELNKKKVLASDKGLPRDWRGLAHLTHVSPPCEQYSPAAHLLAAWEKDPVASLGLLEQFLGELDRWDLVDDFGHHIRDDAKDFMARMHTSPSSELLAREAQIDEQILTNDDIVRKQHGLELQMYDALLLYADEDWEFAKQMVDRLENDFDHKLCLKENLVGGLSFEHHSIMRLISERCHRVIIIVSSSFIKSPVNRFFVTFAQTIAINKRCRIIIPCMYERGELELPMEIRCLTKLDYNRIGLREYDFWQKLSDSLSRAPVRAISSRHSPLTIREMIDSTEQDVAPVGQKALTEKPASDSLVRARAYKSSSDLLSENICPSNLPQTSSKKFTQSTCELNEKNEKKHKSKSPTEFFRKLFRLDTIKQGKKKKSKKFAVRL